MEESSFDAIDAVGNHVGTASGNHHGFDRNPINPNSVGKVTHSMEKMKIVDQTSKINSITEQTTPHLQEIRENATALSNSNNHGDNGNGMSSQKLNEQYKSSESMKARSNLGLPNKTKEVFEPSAVALTSSARVFITYVEDHCNIYVHPDAKKILWQEFNERLNRSWEGAAFLSKTPEIGYIVMARSENSDTFARARILKIRSKDNVAKAEFLVFHYFIVDLYY